MNWTRAIAGVYMLRCGSCGRRSIRIGRGRALGTCYHHDDYCPVQIEERLTAAEARVAPVIAAAGATVGRYRTHGGEHVTVVVTEPHAETSAPGWIATCSGCGWTDDQYACWHELWPAYPNTAAGDIRALLLDQAEEHADFCGVSKVGELVAAWRTADARYGQLAERGTVMRLLAWPMLHAAAAAVARAWYALADYTGLADEELVQLVEGVSQ